MADLEVDAELPRSDRREVRRAELRAAGTEIRVTRGAAGDGASGPGPELTNIAKTRPLGKADAYAKYVSDPSKFGNNAMPKFGLSMTAEQLNQIGQFLAESKGPK